MQEPFPSLRIFTPLGGYTKTFVVALSWTRLGCYVLILTAARASRPEGSIWLGACLGGTVYLDLELAVFRRINESHAGPVFFAVVVISKRKPELFGVR